MKSCNFCPCLVLKSNHVKNYWLILSRTDQTRPKIINWDAHAFSHRIEIFGKCSWGCLETGKVNKVAVLKLTRLTKQSGYHNNRSVYRKWALPLLFFLFLVASEPVKQKQWIPSHAHSIFSWFMCCVTAVFRKRPMFTICDAFFYLAVSSNHPFIW